MMVWYAIQKNDHYLTPKVNSVIGYISEIAWDLDNKKSRSFKDCSKKTGSVPGTGLEPVHSLKYRILSPACLPIPPPRH